MLIPPNVGNGLAYPSASLLWAAHYSFSVLYPHCSLRNPVCEWPCSSRISGISTPKRHF